MPQIVQLTASLSLWAYPKDHAPPHVHLIGADTDAIIDLRDLQVIRGSYRRRDLKIALLWMTEHKEDLWQAWREQHEQG